MKPEYVINMDGSYEFFSISSTSTKLPAGQYRPVATMRGTVLSPSAPSVADKFIKLPCEAATLTLDIVGQFIRGELRDSMAEMGLTHKLTCLLHGAPGTSKSMTIYEVVREAIANDWVVIEATQWAPNHIGNLIKEIHKVEPGRGVLVFWEEVDTTIQQSERAMLQLLDGPNQHADVVYMMTTNYVDRIPARIFQRCRRIPFAVEFTYPTRETREVFFQAKVPARHLPNVNLDEWLEATDGYTLDQCAQLVVSVLAFKRTLADVMKDIERRKELQGLAVTDDDDDDD